MIRAATVEDIKTVYEIMEAYYQECMEKCGYNLKWDKEKAVIWLGNRLWNTEAALNFISQNGEGVVLGELAETWFGPDRFANPHVLYVRREHRNGLIARALLRRFDKEATERGAIACTWQFWSAVSDERIIEGLMKSCGYEYHAPIYRKFYVEGHHASSTTHTTADDCRVLADQRGDGQSVRRRQGKRSERVSASSSSSETVVHTGANHTSD